MLKLNPAKEYAQIVEEVCEDLWRTVDEFQDRDVELDLVEIGLRVRTLEVLNTAAKLDRDLRMARELYEDAAP